MDWHETENVVAYGAYNRDMDFPRKKNEVSDTIRY